MNFSGTGTLPALLLAFCLGSAETVRGDSYAITPPAGWVQQKAQGDFILIAINQDSVKARRTPGTVFFENVIMTRTSVDNVEKSEIQKGLAGYIQGLQQKHYLDGKAGRRENRSYNGVQGALTQVSFKNSAGTPLCNTQFSFLDGSILYAIAFTTPVRDSSEGLKLAESVLGTLRRN